MLVEQVVGGDQDAFAEIVRRYHGTLVKVARAYVGSEETAQDVAQETWLAVIRGIHQLESRSSFKTWLLRICANRAKSAGLREHLSLPVDPTGTEPTVPASRFDGSGAWSDPPEPFTDLVERRVSERAALEAVRRTIDDLPDPARLVVTLRDAEGLSTSEVADLLGLSEANVRVILHRGRARVRTVLEGMIGGRRQ